MNPWQALTPLGEGLIVSPTGCGARVVWAEVVPSPMWRPWTPWRSRWWFEVHDVSVELLSSIDPGIFGPGNAVVDTGPLEYGTLAYMDGGSDGAYTLAGCIRKAMVAVERFVELDIRGHT